jgi:hypothetical protein
VPECTERVGVQRHLRLDGQKLFLFWRLFLLSAAGSVGRFEILPELAILTSDILGSESSTTLVEKYRDRFVQQLPWRRERIRRSATANVGRG